MTIPSGPSVAMNANASGMPPKFAATPENVVSAERIQPGRAVADRRIGDEEPDDDRRSPR